MAYTPSDSEGSEHASDSPEDSQEKSQKSSHEKILEEAKARFKLAEEAESENRREALADTKFSVGDQWDEGIKAKRASQGRPCITINKVSGVIRQVTNDQRQNRPSIKVHPVDEKGDIETAKVRQGLIRHIEYNSNASAARDTAFECAVRGGVGFYRVITDYSDPLSFDQEILVKRIRNPLSVFFDPASTEPDGSDANYAFVTEEISREEYRRLYPKSKLASTGEWEVAGNQVPEWVTKDGARVVEYFYKDYREAEIVQLSGGQAVEISKLNEWAAKEALRNGISPDLTPATDSSGKPITRKTQIPSIKWCKLNGCEVLEETDWLGKWIPIIPVYGEEVVVDNKVVRKGIVRDAIDAQRLYNIHKSYETENIALTPKAPFMLDPKSIENYQAIWATANSETHAWLPYDSKNGTLPAPQRQMFEPAIQGITQAAMYASDDIKSTTNVYDAAMGARSNETSGKAILARANQAQTSTFHFSDNLTRSITHEGRIINDLIPHIYDAARASRIIGEDGEQKVVKLNQPSGEMGKDGQELTYRMDVGKYDVTVDVGPSYASKRQEAAASMADLAKSVPAIAQAAPDLLIKNFDFAGVQELAERLKKTLPPGLADDPNAKKPPIPPEVQHQLKQYEQMIDQLTAQANEQADLIQNKRVEIESKERIEMAKIRADIEIAMLKVGSQEALEQMKQDMAQIDRRLALLKMDMPVEDVTQESGMNGAPEQAAPMPEELAPSPDGGYPADLGAEGMPSPTGGESPGQPMEGMNDDPSNF